MIQLMGPQKLVQKYIPHFKEKSFFQYYLLSLFFWSISDLYLTVLSSFTKKKVSNTNENP